MALPKLDIPTYTLELPSNGEEVKYRPFLVKEQKTLMILQESDNQKDIMIGLQEIVASCTFNKLNIPNMAIFDFEYMFLKIRCKSVGETSELNLLCPDDDETRVNTSLNLDEVDVQVNDEHTDTIQITDQISMILRWPTVKDLSELDLSTNDLVGNVIGSNVLNIVLVVPIIGFFSNTQFEASIFNRDYIIMIFATFIFLLIVKFQTSSRVSTSAIKAIGLLLLVGYGLYISLLANLI